MDSKFRNFFIVINVLLFVLSWIGLVGAFVLKSPLLGLTAVLFMALFGAFAYYDFVISKS